MDLQTQIPITPERNQIDYDSKLLLMGSCFTENIGDKLSYFKFQSLQNPMGILFQPLAIEKLITRTINQEQFSEEDLFQQDGSWRCFEVHSSLAKESKEASLSTLNQQLQQLGERLTSASHIILSLGTAWAYRYIESDEFVANCHKVPQKKFLKELLPVEAISASLENMIALVRDVNPEATFIFTVSPVRHLKDGVVENMRSKSHLIAAVHEVVEPRKQLHYFPSYEIMMDELRDYRFYERDMLHPNSLAIDIIWEKFNKAWMASTTYDLQKEIGNIQQGLQHRPFHPNSEGHQAFQQKLQQKIDSLQRKLPHLRF
ncbi:GSCFA domain-containing protein [Luteirhabdus pelagi]|uniref:GSCFA domain-containing protein n=1 Tax=Luteirhabdus pelagi TaxID=2792783 RepID=UPI001939F9ED|nr:GSCFA domain-containing protein [Luteirhabdus pelagi]